MNECREADTPDVITMGDGPVTVVAVHGIQGTREAWLPVATRLQTQARWVLPNLRGRGMAVRGAGPQDYTLARYAEDLRAVVERHVDPARPLVLAGWSMGVSVCLAYLLAGSGRRPEALVLLSGSPCLCEAPWFLATEAPALHREIAEREQRLGLRAAADHAAVAWTWTAVREQDHRLALADVRVPALIVHGRDDPDSPWSHAEQLAQGLPHAQLVPLADAGHSILSTHTADVVMHMQDFLAAR